VWAVLSALLIIIIIITYYYKTVGEVRALRVIEGDGVHLTARANRNAAVLLCRRIREMGVRAGREFETDEEEEGAGKRRKME
jgi:hypothetical protein